MSNNCIQPFGHVLPDDLSSERYFESLLKAAAASGRFNEGEVVRIQGECLALLAKTVQKYTAGDSSSVPLERAGQIFESTCFTLGVWLKTFPTPDEALNALQSEGVKALYKKGRRRIDTMLAAAKTVHARLLRQLIKTPNVYYAATIDEGIRGFFKLYYPDFAAGEIHITADYPTFNPQPPLLGIEFIKAYLNRLYYENSFCSCFAPGRIHHLLCGYASGYEQMPLNLYEPVLAAALGCVLLKRDTAALDVGPDGPARLGALFSGKTQPQLEALLAPAARTLCDCLNAPQGLRRYIGASLPLVAANIQTAAHLNQMSRVFALPAYPESQSKIIISYGVKMPDKAYRALLSRLENCTNFQQTHARLKAAVHSLADWEDVLQDAPLTPGQIETILTGFSLPELAALSKRHPVPAEGELEADSRPEKQQRLAACLHRVVSALPTAGQAQLATLAAAMQAEGE